MPPGYVLDALDPDLHFLLRPDGARAAAFSARGATAEGILGAAERDAAKRDATGQGAADGGDGGQTNPVPDGRP